MNERAEFSVEDVAMIERDVLDGLELWEEDKKVALMNCAYICGMHDMARFVCNEIKKRCGNG